MTAIEGRMLTPEGKGRTPVLKHSDQPSLGDHRRGLVVEDADKSEPRCRSAQHHGDIVERQLPIDVERGVPDAPFAVPMHRARRPVPFQATVAQENPLTILIFVSRVFRRPILTHPPSLWCSCTMRMIVPVDRYIEEAKDVAATGCGRTRPRRAHPHGRRGAQQPRGDPYIARRPFPAINSY